MEQSVNSISINGVEYVRKDSVKEKTMAPVMDGMKYCIVRTYSAGVFAGYLKEHNGKEATVLNARRIWYWTGAATLSQLAMEGTSSPQTCKFPQAVPVVILTEVIEIIPCTEKARISFLEVKDWKQ